MTLTRKQKIILDYIVSYSQNNGTYPTYKEIQRHFGFKSKGSVQDYIHYIKEAGFLKKSQNARGFELANTSEPTAPVPILGDVAAGIPLDIMEDIDYQFISVPESMVGEYSCFALRVKGNSMIEDSIVDGDFIIVRSQQVARSGDTVVALVNGAATVKRYYRKNRRIELHPANKSLKPIVINHGDFKIQGIVVGLIRKYL